MLLVWKKGDRRAEVTGRGRPRVFLLLALFRVVRTRNKAKNPDTPIATLLDALANFLKEKGLREEDTFFWVCDYVIRQTNVKPDLALLGDCVSAVGHTVLLMEPWHAPAPLKRAYCIKEVYHTQVVSK